MKAGDKIRIKGEGGNVISIVVGQVFDERTITSRLESGSWTLVEDKPKRQTRKSSDES